MKKGKIKITGKRKNFFGEIEFAYMELRSGANGTGAILARTLYQPNSPESASRARDFIYEKAVKKGVQIV